MTDPNLPPARTGGAHRPRAAVGPHRRALPPTRPRARPGGHGDRTAGAGTGPVMPKRNHHVQCDGDEIRLRAHAQPLDEPEP